MKNNFNTAGINVGVVGLGLMGSSIVVSLLLAGHPVMAIAPLPSDMEVAPMHIRRHLMRCFDAGLLSKPVEDYLIHLVITEDYNKLKDCSLVLECVIELPEIKKAVYQKIEERVAPGAVIASNTSAIPISDLQQLVALPERFLGIHWAEPAYMTRFMEITCGIKTSSQHSDWAFELAHYWDKEPTLLKKDLRGFVTNRLMYAVYREAFHIVENNEATLEDVDKAFRYDAGSWMTLMGIFRRMDYMGLEDYPAIFNNIFPLLSNSTSVPALMQKMIERKARGIHNNSGLYTYEEGECQEWEDAFSAFNKEIFHLAAQYSNKLK